MSTENIEKQESEAPKPKSPFYSHNFKWKSKSWWGLILFNVLMVILLGAERIISEKIPNWDKASLFLAAVIFPALLTLLMIYMYKSLKQYRWHESVIKPTRLKYFITGTSCSFCSGLLVLLGLVVSFCLGNGTPTKITIYTFLSICIILGTLSSVFTSMYGFCSAFDIFYHKNKEEIIREYINYARDKNKEIKIGTEGETNES